MISANPAVQRSTGPDRVASHSRITDPHSRPKIDR